MSSLIYLAANPADLEWLDAVRRHLSPHRGVQAWDPRDIPAGVELRQALAEALASARLAVLFVSPHFLAEEFAPGGATHGLLTAALAHGLRILWIPVRASAYDVTEICEHQPLHDARRPLDALPEAELGQALVGICERIVQATGPGSGRASRGLPRAVRVEDVFAEMPSDPGEQNAMLGKLARAIRQRDALRAEGADTASIDARVLEVRKEMRRGQALRAGDVLGDDRYRLLRQLGEGRFASVWLAEDRVGGVQVALKGLHPQYARQPDRRDSFLRGARAMMKLHHDAVVRVLEPCGDDHDHVYFVMEYVDGMPLHDAVRGGDLTRERGVPIVLRIGSALAHAHGHGVIHRDVKPTNILVDRLGRPFITDFDLADGADIAGGLEGGLGAVVYAAPELVDDPASADARIDVYSLAMTAVFVLAGKDLPRDVIRDPGRFIDCLPIRPEARAVLKQATAWSRDERHASMIAFTRALSAVWADGAALRIGPEAPTPADAAGPPDEVCALSVGGPTSAPRLAEVVPVGVVRRHLSKLITAVVGLGCLFVIRKVEHFLFPTAEVAETRASAPLEPVTTPAPTLPIDAMPAKSEVVPVPLPVPASTEQVTDVVSEVRPGSAPVAPAAVKDGHRKPQDRPPTSRASVELTSRRSIQGYARQCGVRDAEVLVGDELMLRVTIDGATGHATVRSTSTLWPEVIACIRLRLEAQRFPRFAGAVIEYSHAFTLK